jgi:hypothetical protein
VLARHLMAPPPLWADETAEDLFTRAAFPGLELLPGFAHCLKVGETLELLGEPSTGKTALLVECAIRCILPSSVDGVAVGGAGSHAVFVDSEGSFDAFRMAEAVRERMLAAGVAPRHAGNAVLAALGRLRVMQCPTSSELILGLCALRLELDVPERANESLARPLSGRIEEEAVELHHEHARPPPAPRLLLIDGLSAFQWIERAVTCGGEPHGGAGGASLPASSGTPGRRPPCPDRFEAQLGSLVALLRRQRLSIVWSRCPLLSHSAGFEFPIVNQRGGAPVDGAQELNEPTMRMRLRRLPPHALDQHVPARASRVLAAVQAMLDASAPPPPAASPTAGTPPPLVDTPLRRELYITPCGVSAHQLQ